MESALAEFLRFMFQPPVLILFCLAVAGFSIMMSDRSDHRFRVNTEWRVRESIYRCLAGFNDDLIARARKRHYARHHIKDPRR